MKQIKCVENLIKIAMINNQKRKKYDKRTINDISWSRCKIEPAGVSTETITNDILNSQAINSESRDLFNKIYSDLKNANLPKYSYKPNFEDIFHALEILNGLYMPDVVAPE